MKVCIKISGPMIWNLVNSKKCVVKLGVENITIVLLIGLKNENKYRLSNESKNIYFEVICESAAF